MARGCAAWGLSVVPASGRVAQAGAPLAAVGQLQLLLRRVQVRVGEAVGPEQGAQLLVLRLRGGLLREAGAELLHLLPERLVLRLGAEEVTDPVPGVAEGLRGGRGAALQRRDHGEHRALHAVRHAALRLAEVRGEQGDGEQQ